MLQFFNKTSLYSGLCLFILSALTLTSNAEETTLSPIAKLNQQKKQQCQVFLPSAFFYGKENTLTVRGLPNQTIKVYYRFLPTNPDDPTQGVKTETLVLNNQKPIAVVTLPTVTATTPKTPETPTNTPTAKVGKNKVSVIKAEEPTTATPNYTGVQLQVVAPEGTPVDFVLASGQATEQRVFPFTQPYQTSGAVVMPNMGALDGNVMRNIQTMADLAQDADKRNRLLYDGKINRDRAIDRNSLVGPGAFGGLGGGQ